MRANIPHTLCFVLLFAGLPLLIEGQGSGVIAVPTSAAYADLTNASNNILNDLHRALPQANTIILYDPATFSSIPYYAITTGQVRKAALAICNAQSSVAESLIAPVDLGSAAQGLASLIQVTLPTYAVQSQNLALDNSALIGSFAAAAKATGYTVINPAYLLPAVSQTALDCTTAATSNSLADLWDFANSKAIDAQAQAATRKSVRNALDAFQKVNDILVASPDKAAPLLARVLAVESLAHVLDRSSEVAVIDMRLDAASIDSTSKNVLWWRKTKFSANVAAHYWVFAAHGSGAQFGITLVQPGFVNILRKDVDLEKFAGSKGSR